MPVHVREVTADGMAADFDRAAYAAGLRPEFLWDLQDSGGPDEVVAWLADHGFDGLSDSYESWCWLNGGPLPRTDTATG